MRKTHAFESVPVRWSSWVDGGRRKDGDLSGYTQIHIAGPGKQYHSGLTLLMGTRKTGCTIRSAAGLLGDLRPGFFLGVFSYLPCLQDEKSLSLDTTEGCPAGHGFDIFGLGYKPQCNAPITRIIPNLSVSTGTI